MLFGSCSGSSLMLILPFSWPVVAFLCPHLHMQPPQVQVVSLEDVRRHCGEGNHRSICPFPSCAALRHLVYLWITAWWLRPDKRTDEPRGGGRSSRTGSYFTSHPANRASPGCTEGGRVVSFEENTKYQAVRISPASEFRL